MDDFVEVTEKVTVVMCEECNSLLWANDLELDDDDIDRLENSINDKVVNVHSAHAISDEMWDLDWHPDYYVVNCYCCDEDIHEHSEGMFVTIDTYGVVEKDDTYGGCVIQTTFECEGCEDCGYDD